MKNFAVIGGSGFVGVELVRCIKRRGDNAKVLDIKPFPSDLVPAVFYQGEIIETEKTRKVIDNTEAVIFLAGMSDLDEAAKNPTKVIQANLLQLAECLDICWDVGVKKFIYCSSLYAGGDVGGFYGWSKYAAEKLLQEYAKAYGTEFTILRIGSVYGRGSDNKNRLHRLVSEFQQSNEFKFSGDIESSREYIHVKDVAKAIDEIAREPCSQEIYAVTGASTVSVRQLFAMIYEISGRSDEPTLTVTESKNHYNTTPCRLEKNLYKKYSCLHPIDFESGLLDLFEYVMETA